MNSRLDSVADWEDRARRAHYRVGELAASCYVSSDHLLRWFRDHKRTPVKAWLLELQISDAAAKLRAPGAMVKVKNIALDTGFREQDFYRAFKHRYGITPGEYARYVQARPVPTSENQSTCRNVGVNIGK